MRRVDHDRALGQSLPGSASDSSDTATSDAEVMFTGTVFCDLVFAGVPVPKAGGEVYAEAFRMTPGGAANRATATARLGSRTMLVSQLGDDAIGDALHAWLAAVPNLDLSRMTRVPGHQTPVSVSLTGAHDRSFITYREPLPLVPPPAHAKVAVAHVSVEGPLPAWAADLRAAGTLLVGGLGWDPTETWSPAVLGRLAEIDVFVPNEVEAMAYTRTDDALAAARALGAHVPLAVVTRGERGVVAFDSRTGTLTQVPAVAVVPVDPTGAGDVFVAAFMTTMSRDWSLEAKLRFASLCASLSVTGLGGAASAPTPPEVSAYLASHRLTGDWSCIREWLIGQSTIHSKEN